jgi:chromosome segregation ATPase
MEPNRSRENSPRPCNNAAQTAFEQAKSANEGLQPELTDATQKVSDLESERDGANQKAKGAERELEKTRNDLAEIMQKLPTAGEQVRNLTQQSLESANKVEEPESQFATANAAFTEAKQRPGQAQTGLTAAKSANPALKSERGKLATNLDAANAELTTANVQG